MRACRNEPADRVPVWFMRQAGRALPEYRSARGTGSILQTVRHAELVAELTMQPVEHYGVDAAILFSDIVVPISAIGFGVDIEPGVGPVVSSPFRSSEDLRRLRPLEPEEDTPYVTEATRILSRELASSGIPLIGFAGAPFTLASYLIEGGPSRTFARTKSLMRSEPVLWADLVDALADISAASLRSQILAGAAAVQLFDSWAGALSPADYLSGALPATKKVFDAINDLGAPRILFGVGTGELLAQMASSGAEVIGVDWRVTLDAARKRVGPNRALQGNLDPAICLAPWDVVAHDAADALGRGGGVGHIFNLGHGVLPETDPATLERLVDLVHSVDPAELSSRMPPGDLR
ncbi:MAG: uroporphyrinogen decarboxylase [Acidimicrobiales bacterium]